MAASCEEVLPYLQQGWTGVEIGVAEGESAQRFLEWGVRFLFMIDPWQVVEGYLDGSPSQEWYTAMYRKAIERLSPFAGRWTDLHMNSAEAAQHIPPPVDFVFVDGNHRYEWVKSDLETYWPLIAPGGVLCGHDYCNAPPTCGVKDAVDEFVRDRHLTLETPVPCWVVRKPW